MVERAKLALLRGAAMVLAIGLGAAMVRTCTGLAPAPAAARGVLLAATR